MRQWNTKVLDTDTQRRVPNGRLQPYQIENPLEAFKRYRPEVDILPGVTWKCSMRSAFS